MTDDIDPPPPIKFSTSPVPEPKPVWIGLVVLAVVIGIPGFFIFNWLFCRIEVPALHMAVLIAKTGDDLPSGAILAIEPGQKGIQLETLPPGRYFRNPLFWDWELHPYKTINPDRVGIRTRLYGQTPPDVGRNLLQPADTASGHFKGIVAEVLMPGDYSLNPWAYSLEERPAYEVPVGYVGVVCNQVGSRPKISNSYLVEEGERGVQRKVLGKGSHYLNPYATKVYLVDIRSHRLEFSGSGGAGEDGKRKSLSAVRFPSSDGFEIEVHLTVEWSVNRQRAPEVFVRIGTGDPKTLPAEILDKTLIPALRGGARIEGSKYPASNYISGESRTKFQDAIEKELRHACDKQGVVIHSVLVNDIVPPNDIASPIRMRQVAKEELTRNQIQAGQAKAEQALAREDVLVDQEKARVLAETAQKQAQIRAANEQAVALIEQEQLLTVANAELAAARLEAEAILSRGKADAVVLIAQNEAAAEALKKSVAAFKGGAGFASYTFSQRIAPGIRSVFASPEGPFGALFRDLIPEASPRRLGGAQ